MKKRTRFFNFLIDSSIFFSLVLIISLLLKDYVLKEDLKYFLIVCYYLYYFLFELFGGQTIGKMITKTRVIDLDSITHPSPLKILIRTLSRLIPIDILSYLFKSRGIHDFLSKTKTIQISN